MITGMPLRWNGRLTETPPPVAGQKGTLDGQVTPNGTLMLSRKILDFINLAYSDRPLVGSDADEIVNALITVGHEAIHLASLAEGPVNVADNHFEESLAEQFGQEYAIDIAVHTGIARRIGLSAFEQGPKVCYPVSVGATGELVTQLDAATQGRHGPEKIFKLALLTPRAERFSAVADMITQSWPDPGSPAARQELSREVSSPMRRVYETALLRDKTPLGDLFGDATKGVENGRNAMTWACRQVAATALPHLVHATSDLIQAATAAVATLAARAHVPEASAAARSRAALSPDTGRERG